MMELKPSEIRYSQSTVSTVFDRQCLHRKKPIEDTFEEICEGRTTISSIPLITVCRHKDQWYTKDNRRLWVFKHLEALGKITTIMVNKIERSDVPDKKFTTSNEGISVGFYSRHARVPSRDWYKKAEILVTNINDRIAQSTSKSVKEAEPFVCELKTETSTKSDSIIYQRSGVEINSDLESSKLNSNGVGIPKTERQEDSTIKICSPENEDDSSLDATDEYDDKSDGKDSLNGKLKSNDHLDGRQSQKSIQDASVNQQLEVRQACDDEKESMESGGKGANSLKRSHVGAEEESGSSHSKIRRIDGLLLTKVSP
ncbi:hypothetical protein ACJMK2_003856 [Sinanodonta woodiana]|uniref:Uncharacterized protein n=1 Tax=Sinanodonta woodiana TaxID=1069815 RepID=A0ABD3Y175_SINWO